MSYAADAVESDMGKQIARLRELTDEIGQLAAAARDCDEVAPKLAGILQAALYLAEQDLYDATGQYSCGHDRLQKTGCPLCWFIWDNRTRCERVLRAL